MTKARTRISGPDRHPPAGGPKANLRLNERIRAGELTVAQAIEHLELLGLTATSTYRKLRRRSA